MPAVSQSVPRLSLLVVSIILTLRDQGQSYRDITKNPRVRKADGSTLSQQGARYVAKKYPTYEPWRNYKVLGKWVDDLWAEGELSHDI